MYCPNPHCQHRLNPEGVVTCCSCGTNLLLEGRYQLLHPLRPLEFSGQTDVFEVADGENRKILKLLKNRSPQAAWRFEKEVLTLRLLDHPSIPKVEDYFAFTPEGSPHSFLGLVLEKMSGQTLEQWRASYGAPSETRVVAWLKQLTEILEMLHQKQLFHRDLKPANIIVRPNGQIALIDFGSVREVSGTYLAKVQSGEITQVISGGYTPPEQIEGKAVPQSDFFALGRTVVFMLTGVAPLHLPRDPQTGRLQWREACDADLVISEALTNLIDDLMAPLPLARPQNLAQILQALTQKPRPRRRMTKKKLWIDAAVAGLAALGVGCLMYPLAAKSWQAEAVEFIHSIETNDGTGQERNRVLAIARQMHEKAALLQFNDEVLQNNLGLVCKEQKDYGCAIAHYQKALDLATEPETLSVIYFNLGVLHEDHQEYESAIAHYQNARRYQPDNAMAANNLARLLIWQRQQPQAALSLLQETLTTNPYPQLQATLLKNLGWAYLQLGNYTQAQTVLEQSLQQQDSAAAACLLAKAQHQVNPQSAASVWNTCLSAKSPLPEVKTWQLDAHQYAYPRSQS